MYTLVVDTHYKDINIFLFLDNILKQKEEEKDVKNTSVLTMPLIVSILDKEHIKINDIGKIAVCIGPGSFTGCRIGVTISKVLAYSLNIPIVSFTSIDLIGINVDDDCFVSVLENNGAFICNYKKDKNIFYMKNEDYKLFKKENVVVEDILLDESKLITFINSLKEENPFNVNPIYIKEIEALK